MQRSDAGLAFLLQYENIAWYDSGKVRILDRRIYPKVAYVTCHTHEEVAKAITDMVTQSAGPFTAGAMGMALAAYECRERPEQEQILHLERAAQTITNARPTTKDRMLRITSGCLEAAKAALLSGEDVSAAIVAHAVATNNRRYEKMARTAEYLVDMIPNNGKVLTQCFGETIVGQMLKVARARNKDLKVYCAETRPYFQGARLTASVVRDMGFDVTVITDNMPAFAMQQEKIDVYTSAADVICMDGHVVNKVGTFQIAIVAKYLGIPYFVTGAPEKSHPGLESVHIEMRDPAFTLQAMGVPTTMEGVNGYYPAFDITPPHLVSGVITDHGIYAPYDLARYFEHADVGEFDIVV